MRIWRKSVEELAEVGWGVGGNRLRSWRKSVEGLAEFGLRRVRVMVSGIRVRTKTGYGWVYRLWGSTGVLV